MIGRHLDQIYICILCYVYGFNCLICVCPHVSVCTLCACILCICLYGFMYACMHAYMYAGIHVCCSSAGSFYWLN